MREEFWKRVRVRVRERERVEKFIEKLFNPSYIYLLE